MSHNLHTDPHNPIIVGSEFRVKATLKDEAGTPVLGASANLTLLIVKPDGTAAAATVLVEDGLGVYSFVYLTAAKGKHGVKVTYSTTFKRVAEGFFKVHDPDVVVT